MLVLQSKYSWCQLEKKKTNFCHRRQKVWYSSLGPGAARHICACSDGTCHLFSFSIRSIVPQEIRFTSDQKDLPKFSLRFQPATKVRTGAEGQNRLISGIHRSRTFARVSGRLRSKHSTIVSVSVQIVELRRHVLSLIAHRGRIMLAVDQILLDLSLAQTSLHMVGVTNRLCPKSSPEQPDDLLHPMECLEFYTLVRVIIGTLAD